MLPNPHPSLPNFFVAPRLAGLAGLGSCPRYPDTPYHHHSPPRARMPGLRLKVLSPLQRAQRIVRKETDCRGGSGIQRTLNIQVPSLSPAYFPEAPSPKLSFLESYPRSPKSRYPQRSYSGTHARQTAQPSAPATRHPRPPAPPHSNSANELRAL